MISSAGLIDLIYICHQRPDSLIRMLDGMESNKGAAEVPSSVIRETASVMLNNSLANRLHSCQCNSEGSDQLSSIPG